MEILDLSVIEAKKAEFDELIEARQPEWPYHNKPHNQESSEESLRLSGFCLANNVRVDPVPIYFAMRAHDLGVHEDYKSVGYDEAEEYTSDIVVPVLRRIGMDEKTVVQPVREIIRVTNPSRPATKIEHKIAKRADVANIGGKYVPFVANSGLLWQEEMIKTGEIIGYEEWARKACGFLYNTVLNDDLSLGPFDRNPISGRSEWQTKGRFNVASLSGMLTRVADIFDAAPPATIGEPWPDYEQLLKQNNMEAPQTN